MDWLRALFSFRGRVGRTSWWIAAGLVAVMVALHVVFVSEESLVAVARLLGRSPASLFLVWGLVVLWWGLMAWIFLATSVRRLADRRLSGWRLFLFLAPAAVAGHFIGRWWPAELAMIASLAWMVGELGLLPGTDDPFAGDGAPGTRSRARVPLDDTRR